MAFEKLNFNMSIESFDFYGLKISTFTKVELKNSIISNINNNDKKIYFGYSFGYFPLYKKYPELYELANNYDVIVTDGRLFYLFAKLLGAPVKFDISIPFLSRLIMDIANENKFSMMIIGSSKEWNDKATSNLKKSYPNAIVCNGYDGGDFSEEAQIETARIINLVSPDILFIGVSSPKKEVFATNWKDSLNVKIIVPFGGMIDGLSGKVVLTPPLLKKLGLATFVRAIQEPKRLFLESFLYSCEILFKIIPKTIFEVIFKRNKSFFIPSIYGLKKK